MMNKRDRFWAFCHFEPVDRVPRYAGYTPPFREKMSAYLGQDPSTYFDTDRGQGARLRPPEGFEFPDYSVYHEEYEGVEGFSIDVNGCGRLSHGFYHFTERISPLRNATTLEEIEAYPIVSNEGWLDDEMHAAIDKAHDEGDYARIWVGHMYETSWQVRGYEPFLMDLLSQRDVAELLLEKFCQNNVRTAVAAARNGADLIAIGDDVGNQNSMMFKVGLWRAVMKPRWARVIAAAREIKADVRFWYHSDGNVWDILDDLVEIGINILNPVQPECMDPVAMRKRMGKRLAFDGCVGTQTTFPFGTVEEMRSTVRYLAEALDARNGGLTLSPTHVLEPEVPPENVVAFFETCDAL